jgi:hypothetical protein
VLLFFLIDVAYIYNAVFHVIFHETAADYIGWVDSPFQIELGFASFGIGNSRSPRDVAEL